MLDAIRKPSAGLMKKKKVEFCSHTGNLAPMRKFVRQFLETYPFSERERMLMVLGVDEACTNIIRHAYHLRDDQLICLSLEGLRNCIRMRLRDYGKQAKDRIDQTEWLKDKAISRIDDTGEVDGKPKSAQ